MSKEEKPIGKITHYFGKIGVAVIEVASGSIAVGDKLRIKGGEREFEQVVGSLQVDKEAVEKVGKGESAGLKVDQPVREGDLVYKA